MTSFGPYKVFHLKCRTIGHNFIGHHFALQTNHWKSMESLAGTNNLFFCSYTMCIVLLFFFLKSTKKCMKRTGRVALSNHGTHYGRRSCFPYPPLGNELDSSVELSTGNIQPNAGSRDACRSHNILLLLLIIIVLIIIIKINEIQANK